jgi:methionyl-tRNA formyltransferase
MTPWPGAFTQLAGRRIKVFTAAPGQDEAPEDRPGTVCGIDEQGIHVAAGTGVVIIRELMGKSGKRLSADAFLRGHSLAVSDRFE